MAGDAVGASVWSRILAAMAVLRMRQGSDAPGQSHWTSRETEFGARSAVKVPRDSKAWREPTISSRSRWIATGPELLDESPDHPDGTGRQFLIHRSQDLRRKA